MRLEDLAYLVWYKQWPNEEDEEDEEEEEEE